jgi:hypothetical protein
MIRNRVFAIAVILLFGAVCLYAADVTGKWSAEFDTQIGVQKYVYEFKVDGTKLTGKAIGTRGDSQPQEVEIQEGKVEGDDISFVENLKFQDQDIRITYSGKVSGDEIKFTRNVADFATEEFVAKRVK